VIANARRRSGPLALALAVTIALAPLAASGTAFAEDAAPPPSSGSGSGSALSQANEAFTVLFMVLKLVDLCWNMELPPGGGAPPPMWGGHPEPLPVIAPVVEAAGAGAPYASTADR